jgi:SNF2 family DNA or RNA helicase
MLRLDDRQEVGVQRVIKEPELALFYKMGKGKTVVALRGIEHLIDTIRVQRVLVVAPLLVAQTVWKDEIRKWKLNLVLNSATGTVKRRGEAVRKWSDIVTVNYENLLWMLENHADEFDMIVFDELSKMKTYNSKRTKKIRKYILDFDRRLGLTGTPLSNGYLDLWGEFFALDGGKRLGKFFTTKYQKKYFFCNDKNGWSWSLKEGVKTKGQIIKRIAPICHTYLGGHEVEIKRHPIRFNLPEWSMHEYRKIDKTNYSALDNMLIDTRAQTLMKCRQYTGGQMYAETEYNGDGDPLPKKLITLHKAKTDQLSNLMYQLQSTPTIIVYEFQHEYDRISLMYPDAVSFKGLSEKASIKMVRDWSDGKIMKLLLQPGQAAHGLNLQYGGHTIVFFTTTWNNEHVGQTLGRLDRKGQEFEIDAYYLLANNTIDVRIYDEILQEKTDEEEEFLYAVERIAA